MINLLPESGSAPPAVRERYNRRAAVIGLIFAVGVFGSVALAHPFSLAAAGAALIGLAWMIYEFVVLMRALDELQQRIHVLALAIGLGAAGVCATVFGIAALVLAPSFAAAHGAVVASLVLPAGALAYYGALFFIIRRFQ